MSQFAEGFCRSSVTWFFVPQNLPSNWFILGPMGQDVYPLVMTNSSPWKVPTINGAFVRWENHLFLWAMASMAMLNNQRV